MRAGRTSPKSWKEKNSTLWCAQDGNSMAHSLFTLSSSVHHFETKSNKSIEQFHSIIFLRILKHQKIVLSFFQCQLSKVSSIVLMEKFGISTVRQGSPLQKYSVPQIFYHPTKALAWLKSFNVLALACWKLLTIHRGISPSRLWN